MDMGLNGKVAVVTGSTEGIGLATVRAFQKEGCQVALCGRSEDKLQRALQSLEPNAFGRCLDMTREKSVYAFAAEVEKNFGHIDIWVNNVGGTIQRKAEWYTEDEIDRTYALCFKSVVFGSQAAALYLKKTKGVIVNVASLAARCASAGRASLYGPLKSAVVNYTNTFAAETAAWGMRVVCVLPGFTLTPLAQRTILPGELERNVNESLLRRPGRPEDIADPIVFLASSRAAYITAAQLEISGGRSRVLNPAYSYEREND